MFLFIANDREDLRGRGSMIPMTFQEVLHEHASFLRHLLTCHWSRWTWRKLSSKWPSWKTAWRETQPIANGSSSSSRQGWTFRQKAALISSLGKHPDPTWMNGNFVKRTVRAIWFLVYGSPGCEIRAYVGAKVYVCCFFGLLGRRYQSPQHVYIVSLEGPICENDGVWLGKENVWVNVIGPFWT